MSMIDKIKDLIKESSDTKDARKHFGLYKHHMNMYHDHVDEGNYLRTTGSEESADRHYELADDNCFEAEHHAANYHKLTGKKIYDKKFPFESAHIAKKLKDAR